MFTINARRTIKENFFKKKDVANDDGFDLRA